MWMWWSALISGFDRHLLGLYLIAKEEGLPVPELYTDPLYAKRFGPTLFHFTCIVWCQFDISSTNVLCVCVSSGGGGNFVLSTSLVGYTTVLGGVAPMVPHGYGFFYRIRDDRFVQKWLLTIPVYCETLIGVRKFNLVSEQAKQFMYFNVIPTLDLELLHPALLGNPVQRQMLKPFFKTSQHPSTISCTSLPSPTCKAKHPGKYEVTTML